MATSNITPPQPVAPAAVPNPAAPAPVDLNALTPAQLREYATTGQVTNPTPPQPQPPAPAPVPQPAPAPAPIAPPATPPAAPQVIQPVKQADGSFALSLPTGQVYKGATEAEVLQQLVQAQINASTHITNQNQEVERLRRTVQAATGVAPAADPNAPAALTWDAAVYKELQNTDPLLAANYLDACRFGLNSIDEVQQVYRDTYATTNEVRAGKVINEFRQLAPDFPGTKESVDAVMGVLQKNKLPFTADNLNMVHRASVHAKVYEPLALPAAPTAAPAYQPAPVPQPTLPTYAGPTGNYAFGPDGFGSRAPMEVETPASAAPVAAQPAAQPLPTAGYPAAPVAPLPAAPISSGGVASAPTGEVTEDAAAGMSTADLRRLIEKNMHK